MAAGVRDAAAGATRYLFTRRAAPFWVAAVAIIAVAAGFIGFGGLAPASRTPAVIATGDVARTSLYSIAVLETEFTDAVESQFLEAEPGETLLVVTVRLENLSDTAVGVQHSPDRVESRMLIGSEPLLELAGVAATGAARSWRADGTRRAVVLQPGVPADVMIAWPIADDDVTAAAFAAGAVRIDAYDAVEQSGQVIVSAANITWRRAELRAQLELEGAP